MLPEIGDTVSFVNQANDEWRKKSADELGVILTEEGITISDFLNYIKQNPLGDIKPTKTDSDESPDKPPDPVMNMIIKVIIEGKFYSTVHEFARMAAKTSWIRKRAEELSNGGQ